MGREQSVTRERHVSLLLVPSEMKERISWYHHPSTPLKVDPVSSGRNYFGRASAPEQMSVEDADDMAECLAAAATMKETVSWFHHPSTPLKVDPASSARKYFQPNASQISTRRLRGESIMDQFEMEGLGGKKRREREKEEKRECFARRTILTH